MLRLLTTLALLNLALLAVEIPRHAGFGPNWFALEALALAGLFVLLPRHWWRVTLARGTGIVFAALTLMALADALARMSLNRPLNLYLDYPLAASVYHLVAGSVSPAAAVVATLALAMGLVAVAVAVARLLGALAGPPGDRSRAARGAGLAILVVGAVGIAGGHGAPGPPRAITPGITLVADQARWASRTRAEKRGFEHVLAMRGPGASDRTLHRLGDVDVILAMIESYGVSAVFDERYAPVVIPRLAAMERAVRSRGLHMVSGTINTPMFGGQSWLAHATLLTGLWIDSHLRYELLLGTERDTLVEDFRRTGHHTVTVMPAITMPWPEGRWFGFDAIHEARHIPYQGPPFHWVTMPDQYTWSFFQHEVRARSTRPLFAKLALVSSHAPWVPILPVIDDWSRIGDGSIFRRWEGFGETPESLWRDHDRVREHYALSVAYAIEVASGYAERFVDGRTLLILMGDHQPARMITGPDASRAAPVHVISGDPALLEPFRERGFVDGALPRDELTERDMDHFRAWMLEGFGS